ncbi:MAG: DinB family protein [Anaerolineae bacterium]
MTKQETLTGLAQSRRALHQAIENVGLSAEEMTQVQVEGVWTVKDVVGHITSWEEVLLKPLRRYAGGDPFGSDVIEDYMAWNDEQAARKRDVPMAGILDEASTIREELVAAANRVPAEQWEQELTFPWGDTGTLAKALRGLKEHEMEHVRAIQQWRDSP